MAGTTVLDLPVLGPIASLSRIEHDAVVVAIGENRLRRALAERLCAEGEHLATVIHPSASVAPSATIGAGSMLSAGAVLLPRAVIGRGVILNTKASADHDSVVGDFAHVAPGATVGANVHLGEETLIGIGASVVSGMTVGARSVIGAGGGGVRPPRRRDRARRAGEDHIRSPFCGIHPLMPIRVCHVIAGATGGVWLVEQLRELRRQYGYEVHAVVGDSEGTLVDLLQAEQIPFHVATFVTSPGHPRAAARAIVDLARYFRQSRLDVVQSHVFWTTLTARPAAWIADVPVRLAMVAGPFHLEAWPSRWLDRATAWMESALIPCCEKIRDVYLDMGVAETRTVLIYYGADTRKFDAANTPAAGIRAQYGWPDETPVVALVAWFYMRLPPAWSTPEPLHHVGLKGQEDFVIAASLIRSEFPEAKFLLVGGPFDEGGRHYMEDVRALVRSLDLEEHVIFTGHRTDVHGVLRDVNVAVQASLSEGLGGTIEGLLMEVPMVVTRVGGMVDTVRDGETGILVDPDSPRDLARGILDLLREPERARTLGRNGRRFMLERFSLERTVSELHALYDRLLADKSASPRPSDFLVSLWRLAFALLAGAYCMLRLELSERVASWTARFRPKPLTSELRRWNLPGDIVPSESLLQLRTSGDLPKNGLFLGDGWHGLERDAGQPFRWLQSDGQIVITRPHGGPRSIVLWLESGPGQDCRAFELGLEDERGVQIDRALVSGRREITFHLPLGRAETAWFRLTAPAGIPIATDPRILNLRVFRISWEAFCNVEPHPAEKPAVEHSEMKGQAGT